MDIEQAASPRLPDDIEALRAMVMALMTERDAVTRQLDAVTAERDTLLERNERLHHLLLKLKRMQFGTKSERLPDEQLQLGLEAIEQAIARVKPRRRSVTPSCGRTGLPSAAAEKPRCRGICRGSR
jgi:Transposase C of IS166 homeodomain